MKLKSLLFATSCTVLCSTAAMATPIVTFQGEVTSQTCEPSIAGDTNSTVMLPTVPASELSGAGNKTGLTPFTIKVTNCQVDTADVHIGTKFLGHNVTTGGNLGNLAINNPAKNVAIELTTDATGATPIVLNGVTNVPGLVLPKGETSAEHNFGAQYIAEGAAATAGAVTAVAEYTLSYN